VGFATAYECTLGGHAQYTQPGIPVFYLYIAQDLSTAQTNMRFALSHLQQSEWLQQEVENAGIEQIRFKAGIILQAEPPNIKTSRGSAVCGMTGDEIAFWYKDAKSANPDFEVIRAVDYAQQQFPHAKQFRISTPWTKQGVLYEAWRAGTRGSKLPKDTPAEDRAQWDDHLVMHAPTAMSGNPLATRARLARLRKSDLEAFIRESLAQFIDSQASYLSHPAIEQAIDPGVTGPRPLLPEAQYVAAIDPAFRRDSFTFTVLHNEADRGVVQDELIEWQPSPDGALDPDEILRDIGQRLKVWGDLGLVYSDQYQLEALRVIAERYGFTIIGHDLTTKSKAKVMADLRATLNQRRLRLLDHQGQRQQLKDLQKTIGAGNAVQIAAPPGKHDDIATVLALGVSKAIELPPLEGQAAAKAQPTYQQEHLQRLRQKWHQQAKTDPEVKQQLAYAEHLQLLGLAD
jgi:hypothetical protein